MSFMQLYTRYMQAYLVETNIGTCIVPADLVGGSLHLLHEDDLELALDELTPYCEGEPKSFEMVKGWFARYSADGFMDQTDWVGPFQNEEEARKNCKELYGDDEDNL